MKKATTSAHSDAKPVSTFAECALRRRAGGPSLFNASLEGATRRAIDFHEGDTIDEKALNTLIRAAVALNTVGASDRRPRPLSEETKERLRGVVKPAPPISALGRGPGEPESCGNR